MTNLRDISVPTRSDIINVLNQLNHVIVHMSSYPKLSSHIPKDQAPMFPDDLSGVIKSTQYGSPMLLGLSCSTVGPGDSLDAFSNVRNSTGEIGLVLDVRGHSVIDTHFTNCGSLVDPITRQRVCTHHRNIRNDLLDSIQNRGSFNEWVIGDYQPIGIMVKGDGTNVNVVEYDRANQIDRMLTLSFDTILAFSKQHQLPIYSFNARSFTTYDEGLRQFRLISHNDIYYP